MFIQYNLVFFFFLYLNSWCDVMRRTWSRHFSLKLIMSYIFTVNNRNSLYFLYIYRECAIAQKSLLHLNEYYKHNKAQLAYATFSRSQYVHWNNFFIVANSRKFSECATWSRSFIIPWFPNIRWMRSVVTFTVEMMMNGCVFIKKRKKKKKKQKSVCHIQF